MQEFLTVRQSPKSQDTSRWLKLLTILDLIYSAVKPVQTGMYQNILFSETFHTLSIFYSL